MADTTSKDEEVENGVHITTVPEGIEQRTGDIAHTLCNDPDDGGRADGIHQRLKGDKDAHAHTYIYYRLKVAMRFQLVETRYRSQDSAEPDKTEQCPAPVALVAQGYERYRRIRACDMPVDSGMIPFPQTLLPRRPCRQGMIERGSNIGAEHPHEIEDDTGRCPTIAMRETKIEEDGTEGDT